MKMLLNTLYVTTPNAYLSKDGENVVVSVDQKEVFRIPIINIESIITFGYIGASPGLMYLCASHGVSLSFLSPRGRFIARMQGPVHGNVLLRKAQFLANDNKNQSLHMSKLFIAGKIQNCRSVLRRYIRDYGADEQVERACKVLERSKSKALSADCASMLLGIEGDAANTYFGVLNKLILNQKNDFPFSGRNRRPPKDAVNAMLSFVYTLLANDVAAALEAVGLDPCVGFFHTIRPGRFSLALDVMEEFRAYLADRLVLSLINRKQVTKRDFIMQGDRGILMTEGGRKTVLTAWQNRKRETIMHPFTGEKTEIGLIPHIQATMLARYIRNDINDYPVFLTK